MYALPDSILYPAVVCWKEAGVFEKKKKHTCKENMHILIRSKHIRRCISAVCLCVIKSVRCQRNISGGVSLNLPTDEEVFYNIDGSSCLLSGLETFLELKHKQNHNGRTLDPNSQQLQKIPLLPSSGET